MLYKRNGFTIAELAVTMGVIGVIAALVIPAIFNSKPNEELIKFRKAYYLTERLVSELVNNDTLYHVEVDDDTPPLSVVDDYKDEYKLSKFCVNFVKNFNISELKGVNTKLVACSEHNWQAGVAPSESFKTSDGVVWNLPVTTFSDPLTPAIIAVDVNGDKGPNCRKGNVNSGYTTTNCGTPSQPQDRFNILVYSDGRVMVEQGSIEEEFLKRKDITVR